MQSRNSRARRLDLGIGRWCVLLALLSLAASAQPQTTGAAEPQPAPQDGQGYTLHVYADLVEIPALVLSPQRSPIPLAAADKFDIRLDSGPVFHPTHVQLEGDEPLTLAIFLDLTGSVDNLKNALGSSIAAFAANSLRAHDHVSIYAIDCNFIRTANNLAANDPSAVANAFDGAIDSPRLRNAKGKSHCGRSLQLWNALATVAKDIADKPGRRVILAVTDGSDAKSTVKPESLRQFCDWNSITIFGLSPFTPRILNRTALGIWQEQTFDGLAQLTGGMVLYTSPAGVQQQLRHVMDLVRGRYLLEFPRPSNGDAGMHSIDVRLEKTNDFIRPAGISYPHRDPAQISAPDTIPSAPSPAIFGDRKILKPPH